MNTDHGYADGDTCNRDGCQGIIKEHDTDTCCSCHDNPPCSHCTTSREYCPACGWDGEEEQQASYVEPTPEQIAIWNAYHKRQDELEAQWRRKWLGEEEATEIETRHESHTYFSQIINGVYPRSMPISEVYDYVRKHYYNEFFGGGRWQKAPGNGTFSWIQYTD
jgi:hypothetical protein